MQVFEYFSDREQEMRAEGEILEHEAQTVGTCRACLNHSTRLDTDGLCAACEDQPARAKLLALLAPRQLMGTAQGTTK
ncbi:hypothetical protein C5C39_06920 [Rathayibacter sp. AY1F3]|nr:hypothetical protein C5C39_06920 [Rathayibacter sp. AY1F3]